MDFKQNKLTKSEWNSMEILVSPAEKEVLKLIKQGYNNVNIKFNKTESLFSYLKIDFSSSLEDYLYSKYFADKIKNLIEKYRIDYIQFSTNKRQSERNSNVYVINVGTIVKLKSADQVRVSRFDAINESDATDIYEYILLHHLELILKYSKRQNNDWKFHYYTLNRLVKNNVNNVIHYVKDVCKIILDRLEPTIDLPYILKHSSDIIEKNKNLLKYSDLSLYNHQKDIFASIKSPRPKLILYIAPTGTGKTLTPLGISEQYRVIFVCAARHVGLALARSAISIEKKIAFAFGCTSSTNIRLHYFAATDYTKDWKSGQIRKVNNDIGDKVEIMICDVRSYVTAMHYMLSFNEAKDIVTYWDEPTISMDYESHELHRIIRKNWKENLIPNVVLSSATLPKLNEIDLTINDFKQKFTTDEGIIPEIINIVSHDCRKTIPLIDNNGYISMPHYLSNNYDEILSIVSQCEQNLTIMRYIDLKEASQFCSYVTENEYAKSSCSFERNFASIDDIDMTTIKLYYLKVLKNIRPNNWQVIYNYFITNRNAKLSVNQTVDVKGNKITKKLTKISSVGPGVIPSNVDIQRNNIGIYVTTRDAYTLTDGPTIFLANDLQKIAKFCIQQSNIPVSIMQDIQNKLEFNSQINERISDLERQIELEENKIADKLSSGVNELSSKKQQRQQPKIKTNKTETRQTRQMIEELNALKSMIKRATLDDLFIPNKLTHLNKWAEGLNTSRSFTSDIDDEIIESIMLLKNVDDSWKILLLLGIGVFTQHRSIEYSEIMKSLADRQKLYLIIADSDYIYGTNYQFCHGYLSKDLNLTQEKIIQSLGRIGRNNIQQEYTVRFRDQSQIETLFKHLRFDEKPEVINMNILFNSQNIKWDKDRREFIEFDDDEDDLEYTSDDEYDSDSDSDELKNDDYEIKKHKRDLERANKLIEDDMKIEEYENRG